MDKPPASTTSVSGSARPRSGVDVAADCGYGRDLRERLEDFWSADVAGVEDAVGSAQRFDGLGPQQAVRVGDYTKSYSFARHLAVIFSARLLAKSSPSSVALLIHHKSAVERSQTSVVGQQDFHKE